MDKSNLNTTNILVEHSRVNKMRHWLAVVNFVAVLIGTIVTLVFTTKRGCSHQVMTHLYILLVINVLQVALCVADYVLKNKVGLYIKILPCVSYGLGGLWLLALIGEMVSGSVSMGVSRIDLLIVAVLQLVVAIIAYVVWPALERKAIDAMTLPSVRNDHAAKAKKSRHYAVVYIVVCLAIVLLQGMGLLAYKLPPTPYDLFAESRALKYRETDDGSGYIVESMYSGQSTVLNVPAYYNDKPVVGIAKDAIVETSLLDKNKISSITIGTPAEDDDGNTYMESYVKYIESGAIQNDKIESLQLPSSVERIDTDAIRSSSLKTLTYMAAADFEISDYRCDSLERIVMDGKNVGKIASLDGMAHSVKIEVGKDIYDQFRQNNIAYINSFEPILADDEFCIRFYTDCDYYINSIFAKKGDVVNLSYRDLTNADIPSTGLDVDTGAYLHNPHELGTNGAKAASAFRGWYYNSSLTNECVFTESGAVSFTESASLYAKWIDEYTGTFDWGTFTPTDAVRYLYWTDDDVVEFPVKTDRDGFKDGITWYRQGTSKVLTSSYGISQNINVLGKWNLDKPEIDIEPMAQGDKIVDISQSKDEVTFTYDENRSVVLKAAYVTTDKLSQLQFGGRKTTFKFNWRSDSGKIFSSTEITEKLQNVADSGVYTLIVTAQSPYDPDEETSQSETSVRIRIDRKDLDLGSVTIANKNTTYNSVAQKIDIDGVVPTGLTVRYEYYSVDSSNKKQLVNSGSSNAGVIPAGAYSFAVTYAKSNPVEAANYNTATIEASLNIEQCPLVFDSWGGVNGEWNDNTVVYDGQQHSYVLNFTGVQGSDSVQLVYENNGRVTSTAKEASTYTTKVTGVNNVNYTLSGMNQSNLQKDWTILQKKVTVAKWNVDDNGHWNGSSVTYDGNAHSVAAVLSGAVDGENIQFIYNQNTPYVMTASGVGNYTAEIIGINSSNYYFDGNAANSKQQFGWAISPKALTLTYSNDSDLIYSGERKGATATISGIVPKDKIAFTLDKISLSSNSGTAISTVDTNNVDSVMFKINGLDAGTYNVNVAGFTSPTADVFVNYTLQAKSTTFDITPKTLTLGDSDDTYTYNGSSQRLRVPVIGIVAGDIRKEDILGWFTQTGATSGEVVDGQFYLIRREVNAGEYSISITTACSNGNYVCKAASKTVTIDKKELSITGWNVSGSSNNGVTYNGQAHGITATVSGVATGDTVVLDLTNNVQTNVGEYTTKATLDADKYPNYVLNSNNTTRYWYISQAPINITWVISNQPSSRSFVYDGQPKTVVPQFSTHNSDEVTLVYDESNSDLVKTNVGSYSVKAIELSGADASNYVINPNTASLSWSITAKTVTASWDSVSAFTYNGQYQGPSLSLIGLVGSDSGQVTVSVSGAVSASKSLTSSSKGSYLTTGDNGFAVNAGSYSVVVTNFSNGNYTLSSTGTSKTFTINRKTLRLTGQWTCTGGTDLVYSNTEYTCSTSINADDLVKHLNAASTPSFTINYKDQTAKNAGNYTTEVTGISGTYSTNYVLETGNNLKHDWTIKPRQITGTWLYSATSPATYAVNEISNTVSFGSSSGKYTNDTVEVEYSNNCYIDAGSYVAKATSKNANYVISNNTQAWAISPKTISALDWTSTEFIYDGQIHHPVASYTYKGQAVTVSYSGDTAVKNANSNKYSITAASVNSKNYDLSTATNKTVEFTIKRRELSVVWNGFTSVPYDGKAHELTASWSNVVSGETVALTYDTARSLTNAGSLTVFVNTTLTDHPNYIVANGAVTSKTITISPRELTLSWSGATDVVYDGSAHRLTASWSNVVSGETIPVTYVEGNSSITDVGSLKVTVSTAIGNSNYAVASGTVSSKTLTISSRPANIIWYVDSVQDGSTTLTYSGSKHTLSARVTTDNGEIIYTRSVEGTDAGKYTLNADMISPNYTVTGSKSKTLTINPAAVTITWSATNSYVYNGSERSLTATVKGVSNATVACSGNTARGTNVGSYTTTVTLNDSNYTLTGVTGSVTGTLTITPQPVKITWSGSTTVTYDGTARTVAATVVGKNDNKAVACVSNSVIGTDAGSYTAQVVLNDLNYTLTNAEGNTTATLKINPCSVAIVWSVDGTQNASTTLTYDGQPHTLSAAVTGVNGAVACIGNTVNGTNVGTYSTSIVLNNSNYKLPSTSAATRTLTINPRTVTIKWTGSATATYNGAEHSATATVKGVNNDDDVSCSGNTVKGTNAGTYSTYIVLKDSNYKLPNSIDETFTLTIKPCPVVIQWKGSAAFVTYDGYSHICNATVTGVNGESVACSGTTVSGTNVGKYRADIKLNDPNYTLENAVGPTFRELEISKASITLDNVLVTLSEGDDVQLAMYQIDKALKYKYADKGVIVEYVIMSSDSDDEVTGALTAGTYVVKLVSISGVAASNYNFYYDDMVEGFIGSITVNEAIG